MHQRKFIWTREIALSVIFITLVIIFGLANPKIVTVSNLIFQLKNATAISILSVAILPVMITGGIDLSFVVITGFARGIAVIVAGFFGHHAPAPLIIVIAGAIGALLSLVNCFFITKYKIPSIITTIATSEIIVGLSNLMGGVGRAFIQADISGISSFFNRDLISFINTSGLHIRLKYSFLVPVVLSILMWLFLKYTSVGRHIYAVGGDAKVAHRLGINVPFTMGVSYAILGFVCGIFGVMQMGVGTSNSLGGAEFNVIACVTLGGLVLGAGNGSVGGTLLAIAIITLVQNSCILLGIPVQAQKAIVGAILILSLISTTYNRKGNLDSNNMQRMK